MRRYFEVQHKVDIIVNMDSIVHRLAEKTRQRGPIPKTTFIRVALTMFGLCGCLFLITLWVRSYTLRDSMWFRLYGSRTAMLFSNHGTLQFETSNDPNDVPAYFVLSLTHADISAAWRRFTSDPEPQ